MTAISYKQQKTGHLHPLVLHMEREVVFNTL